MREVLLVRDVVAGITPALLDHSENPRYNCINVRGILLAPATAEILDAYPYRITRTWQALPPHLERIPGAFLLRAMLRRLRRAMVRPERERLSGLVEVDETYMALGDRDQPVARGRGKKQKSQTLSVVIQ